MKLSLGLQVYSVRNEMKKDFWGALEKIAEIGYKYVEFANHSAETDFGCGHNIDAVTLKSRMDALGLQTIGNHVHPLGETDLDRVIEYNQIIGNNAIGCGIGFYKNKAEVINFSHWLNSVGEKCRKRGMNFYYHNHFEEFQKFDGQYVMDIMLENTDQECVKIQLDTYWAMRGGVDPVAWLQKLGDRCIMIHQKDLPARTQPVNIFATLAADSEVTQDTLRANAQVENFTEPGEGIMDIKSIIATATKIGVSKYIIIEQDKSSRNELDSVTLGFKNMTKLLNANQ